MKKKQKYYVVWKGYKPGVYSSWSDCQSQIDGFKGNSNKSFSGLLDAQKAFELGSAAFQGVNSLKKLENKEIKPISSATPFYSRSISIAVRSISTNDEVGYRAILVDKNHEIFNHKLNQNTSIEMAEYLAITHALAYCQKEALNMPIYVSSKVVLDWIKDKKPGVEVERSPANQRLLNLIERSKVWFERHEYKNSLLIWDAKAWGDNPAFNFP